MPGTIQVTVLEFKDDSSSSKPSARSLIVSMGKRHYQTWDKGDFSFPITKLHENLVVALLDAGGHEIAHQDIRTIQIIEKGYWDEVFSINGGGRVHMKLQFILSEEERSRIRTMRESAVKKKLEMNPNIKLKLSEVVGSTDSVETSSKDEQEVSDFQKGFAEIDVGIPKVEAPRDGLSFASATSPAFSLSNHLKEGDILGSAIANATDGSQGTPSSPGKHEMKIESTQVQKRVDEKIKIQPIAHISDIKEGPSSMLSGSSISVKNNTVACKLQDDHPIQKSTNQGSVEKTPSSVRKMISAFENSQLQEVKSLKKTASVPSQLNRFRKEGLLEDEEPKDVVPLADKSLRDFNDYPARTVSGRAVYVSRDNESSQASKQLSSTVPQVMSRGNDLNTEVTSGASLSQQIPKELEKFPVDSMRHFSSETATGSGRMPDEHSQVNRPYKLPSKLVNSSESSVAEGSGRVRGTGLKSSNMIMTSNPKRKTLEYYKEEYYSGQNSGMWIFPDNTRNLCITTAGKQASKIVGNHNNEARIHHQAKKMPSEIKVPEKNVMHETELENKKKHKNTVDQPEPGSGSSPDDLSNGLVGQVIKFAVIIGFGLLVLLTRQKEPRKKHVTANIDDSPWTGKQ